ncbi:hypothetical protein [Micromonospora sp. SH-82]|uniref:hypothetical protein n=1 Tax=Micromonospora sp. SH-82 TaxID=3132938 RepID=UPI003EBBE466
MEAKIRRQEEIGEVARRQAQTYIDPATWQPNEKLLLFIDPTAQKLHSHAEHGHASRSAAETEFIAKSKAMGQHTSEEETTLDRWNHLLNWSRLNQETSQRLTSRGLLPTTGTPRAPLTSFMSAANQEALAHRSSQQNDSLAADEATLIHNLISTTAELHQQNRVREKVWRHLQDGNATFYENPNTEHRTPDMQLIVATDPATKEEYTYSLTGRHGLLPDRPDLVGTTLAAGRHAAADHVRELTAFREQTWTAFNQSVQRRLEQSGTTVSADTTAAAQARSPHHHPAPDPTGWTSPGVPQGNATAPPPPVRPDGRNPVVPGRTPH